MSIIQPTDPKIAAQVAKMLLEIKAVTFRFDPPFTYTSGIKSPIYLDNRLVMSYPKIRDQIAQYYVQTMKDHLSNLPVDYLSATAMAAIPMGAFVAQKMDLPLVFVRPNSKMHGKENKLEGYLKPGSHVVIIEDHISTAGSVLNNAQTVRDCGGLTDTVITTSIYSSAISEEEVKKAKLRIYPLTTADMIVKTALDEGIISSKEQEAVSLWFADPQGWGKKMGFV